MSKTIEEIKEQYAKDFERDSFEDMIWSYAESENGINDFIMIVDEIAERYAQSQTQELTAWKESASKVFKNLDLQTLGKTLGIGLGEDISVNVMPKIKELQEQNAELELGNILLKDQIIHLQNDLSYRLALLNKKEEQNAELVEIVFAIHATLTNGVSIQPKTPLLPMMKELLTKHNHLNRKDVKP